MATRTPAETVEAYIAAYNAHDNEQLLRECDENVYVTHHNRDLLAQGRAEFREMLTKYIGLMPNKRMGNRRGFYVDGNMVVVEHTWFGTAVQDVPGYATKDVPVAVDLCTVFTVRNGLVTAYHDYG